MLVSNIHLTCSLPRVCRSLSLSFTQLRTKSSLVGGNYFSVKIVSSILKNFLNVTPACTDNQKYQNHAIANTPKDCICFIPSPKVLIYEEV